MKILVLLVLMSCNQKVSTKNLNSDGRDTSLITSNSETVVNNQTALVEFIPDTIVNKSFILKNRESSFDFFIGIKDEQLINNFRESPVIILLNKTEDKYIMLYQNEGGALLEFDKVEIGYKSDLESLSKENFTKTAYDNFYTQSDVALNMNFNDFIEIKGENYSRKGEELIYTINDFSNSEFLQRYNLPQYSYHVEFKNGVINKIIFGFDIP